MYYDERQTGHTGNTDINKLTNKSKIDTYEREVKRVNNNNCDNEEWIEILRAGGTTPEELDRLAKNKANSKIIEAIEMLSRLLVDKNFQVRLLEEENDSLNQKNFALNKENISLFQMNIELKKELQKYVDFKPIKTKTTNEVTNDSSMVYISYVT